jgi:CO/xanthine dehydrogenase Mo-binding subunit/aerobic-type carbon monoxide dehydrogenase small subunit (CoxS/CutS family)
MPLRDQSSPQINFTLDGAPRSVPHRANESLLEVLRERCGVTSLKDGCRPQGSCGACLALVDGEPRVTCTLPSEEADGALVTTLAGLPMDERDRLVRAFAETTGGDICGYCLPAIALRAYEFIQRHPDPTRLEIEKALDGHLCRCSGYWGFVRAIEHYALEKRQKEKILAADESTKEASEQVLGEKNFIADMTRPGILHGAVVLSAHARARIKKIDVSRALEIPGVVTIMTAADVPGERYQGLLERDWPVFIAVGEETRCVGDVLAAIAAEEPAIAREAAKCIEIDYEVLEPLVDPETALAPSAPRVNPKHDNLLARTFIRRGNVDDELERSQHVARGIFTTQRIEHLFLEPECALAEMLPDGRLGILSQGQSLREERRQIASLLGVAEDRIVVQLGPNSGAMGGKEDLTIQAHAALLTWKTGRPVKLPINREQSIRMHPKKHPMRMEYQVGCDAEGHLTAVRARILGDSGAYASVGAKVLERAANHAAGPYLVPHVDVEAWAVYTNNPPSGAMRGFGVPQVTFALESCLDDLAELAGIDRWDIRHRNIVHAGDQVTNGQVLNQSVGIERCMMAIKPVWDEAERLGHAVGIACGIRNDSDEHPISVETEGQSPRAPYGFAVQLVQLDESGHITRVVAAHDVAKSQNPASCQRQIEGAIHMGLGYALTEQLDCVKGMPTTFRLRDLGVLRARDMPIVEVILAEEDESDGSCGAKAVGEIALVPAAAAVASALRVGDGTTRRNLPMRDSSAAKAMSVGKDRPRHRSPAARVYVHRGPG